jgi:hypothetical protein
MGRREFFLEGRFPTESNGFGVVAVFQSRLGAETPWSAAASWAIVGEYEKDDTADNFVVAPGGLRYVVSDGTLGRATGCDVHWLPICLGGFECACGQAGYVHHGAHASAPRLPVLFRDGSEVFVDRRNGGNLPQMRQVHARLHGGTASGSAEKVLLTSCARVIETKANTSS